VSTSLTVTSH
jgi:hypothetical protein